MSYDWWARWDRVACRLAGHSWLDHQPEWLGAPLHLSTCIRCGANSRARARTRHGATV